MPRADIELLLERAIRRRRRLHAAVALAAATLAIASTLAVRIELTEGRCSGAAGVVISLLEFVFITGIIPLIVTTLYYGSSAASLHRKLSKMPSLPKARLQKLI